MYKSQNNYIVTSGTTLTFKAEATGNVFKLCVVFVAKKDEHGHTVKGARILPGYRRESDPPSFPEGAQLYDGMGMPFMLGEDRLIEKRTNACTVTDNDGTNYELFRVQHVDQDEDGSSMNRNSIGVIYFHADAAIPPELGGEGTLKHNPDRALEGL